MRDLEAIQPMGFPCSSEATDDTTLGDGSSINFILLYYIGSFTSDVNLIRKVFKIKVLFRVGYMGYVLVGI
jgi:hypothetical protein